MFLPQITFHSIFIIIQIIFLIFGQSSHVLRFIELHMSFLLISDVFFGAFVAAQLLNCGFAAPIESVLGLNQEDHNFV